MGYSHVRARARIEVRHLSLASETHQHHEPAGYEVSKIGRVVRITTREIDRVSAINNSAWQWLKPRRAVDEHARLGAL